MKRDVMRMVVGMGAVLVLAGVGPVGAAIIAGGDFSDPYFAGGKPWESFAEGIWSYHQGEAGLPCDVVGTGAGRHVEINKEGVWWNSSYIFYRSTDATPTTMAWAISGDLHSSYTTDEMTLWPSLRQPMVFMLLDADGNSKFEMNFAYTAVSWVAGSASGTFTSATGLDTTWRTAAIQYNPLTGEATGTLGSEVIFSTTLAGTDLAVKEVRFGTSSSATTSTMFIDNVTFVPEPMTMALLGLGGLLLRRRTA